MNTSTRVQENLSLTDLPNEIWKDIPNYEGCYQASTLGRIKSLSRKLDRKGSPIILNERILKQTFTQRYYKVKLSKNGYAKQFQSHQLIAMAFLGHKPNSFVFVVDHKDNNQLNNHVDNLQIITNRENSSKDKQGYTSKYIGVSWHFKRKRWRSAIYHNGAEIHLGYFKNQKKASQYYKNALKAINEGSQIIVQRRTETSKYRGVAKKGNKWRVKHNSKYMGTFHTEEEAWEFKQSLSQIT